MDSSEEQERDYPPRLYAEGDSNLENRSINHCCKMGEFPAIREAIGVDVWDAMKELPLGVIPKLVDSSFVWSGKTVHYLLCRQLQVRKKEIWCLIGGQPIRYSLHEFGWITGLNTGPMPNEKWEPDYKMFWRELNVPFGEGPKVDELRVVLQVCRAWPFEKRKWLGLLFLQAIGIYGLHHNSRIPFQSAIRVFDDEAVRNYPWGRMAFDFLVTSIKMLNPQGKSYTLNGMVPALQAWAYESVTCFGERFGKVVNPNEVPLIRWGGLRTRSSLETVISEEINTHGEVRVMKMLDKDLEELFPQWEMEEDDPQLNNLIVDIHQGNFVKGFWDVKAKSKSKHESEFPRKKEKVMKDKLKRTVSNRDEVDEEYTVKRQIPKRHLDEQNLGSNATLECLVNIMQRMSSRFEMRFDELDCKFVSFETRIREIIGEKVEGIVDTKYGGRLKGVEDRIGGMEAQYRLMMERLVAGEYANQASNENSQCLVRWRGEEVVGPAVSYG